MLLITLLVDWHIQGVPKKRTFRISILQADTSERSDSSRLESDLPEVSGRRMLILKVCFFGTPCMPSYIAMSFKRYGTLAIWAAISKKYKQKLGVGVSHTGYSILKFSELAKIVSKTKEMQLLRKDAERDVSILKKYWGCHISWSRKFPQRPTCSISPAYIKAV